MKYKIIMLLLLALIAFSVQSIKAEACQGQNHRGETITLTEGTHTNCKFYRSNLASGSWKNNPITISYQGNVTLIDCIFQVPSAQANHSDYKLSYSLNITGSVTLRNCVVSASSYSYSRSYYEYDDNSISGENFEGDYFICEGNLNIVATGPVTIDNLTVGGTFDGFSYISGFVGDYHYDYEDTRHTVTVAGCNFGNLTVVAGGPINFSGVTTYGETNLSWSKSANVSKSNFLGGTTLVYTNPSSTNAKETIAKNEDHSCLWSGTTFRGNVSFGGTGKYYLQSCTTQSSTTTTDSGVTVYACGGSFTGAPAIKSSNFTISQGSVTNTNNSDNSSIFMVDMDSEANPTASEGTTVWAIKLSNPPLLIDWSDGSRQN